MIDHQDKDDLAKHAAVPDELSYLPRIGDWEVDVINRIETWSDNIFHILELPLETKPDHATTFRLYPEPYQGMLKKAINNATQNGTSWDLELEVVTDKGKIIWVRSYGNAVIVDNKVLRVRGHLVDIDQYRTSETSFNLLKQRHRQLSGFTHVLTHNLRNHANNISMLAGLVDVDTLDEGNADLLAKISQVSANLSTTIEHLSEIMKVNENVMESENLEFETVLKAVTDLLGAELEQHGVKMETDFTVPTILFPTLYLESILVNLVSNSVKYRKENEVPEILISTYTDPEKNGVILEYQDNGIGIDLKKHGDQLFGLYKTFTNRPGAHGVGLFLVKTQVESQGGYIVVESKPGVGTIFRIYFK